MNSRVRIVLLAVVAALAAGGPAVAGDMTFGLQGAAVAPVGALRDAVDGKVGYALGANLMFDLTDGHVLRPRLDYLWFPEAVNSKHLKIKLNDLSVGLDYLYFVDKSTKGLYITGGVAVNRWKNEAALGTTSGSETLTKFGAAAGIGYFFSQQAGVEVRYLASYAGRSLPDTISAIQGSVLVRF